MLWQQNGYHNMPFIEVLNIKHQILSIQYQAIKADALSSE